MRTWEQLTEREQLLTYISDCYKDAYGMRPRFSYDDYSVAELKVELDRLVEIANAQYEEEQRMQAQNWKDLHTHFAGLVNIGAKDFRQALIWDMDAEEVGGDFDYYCFKKGVSYSKARVFKRLAA
tara:strand:- start:4347 stop:4721 length:375 start_codon:yes stop_codon:yes gene_type:complete